MRHELPHLVQTAAASTIVIIIMSTSTSAVAEERSRRHRCRFGRNRRILQSRERSIARALGRHQETVAQSARVGSDPVQPGLWALALAPGLKLSGGRRGGRASWGVEGLEGGEHAVGVGDCLGAEVVLPANGLWH